MFGIICCGDKVDIFWMYPLNDPRVVKMQDKEKN